MAPEQPAFTLSNVVLAELLLLPWFDRNRTPVPEHVWHYTDATGAAGIIANKELWATDALFMNDASELQLVHALFDERLDSRALRKLLPDAAERAIFTEAFDLELASFQADPGVYAVCFCETGDLLSQWRTYGRRGGGYALAFDASALASIDQAVIGTFDFFKVIYSAKEQQRAVREFCDHALALLTQYATDERERDVRDVGKSLGRIAQWFAARVKHHAFTEEQEWRFIYRHSSGKRQRSLEREFRGGELGLVPYTRLPLSDLCAAAEPPSPFPLQRVRVGPTARVELGNRAMNYLLRDSGFAFEAEPSAIPLRG